MRVSFDIKEVPMGCNDFYPSQAQMDESLRLAQLRDRGFFQAKSIMDHYYECRDCGDLVHNPDLHETYCPADKEKL